MTSRRLSFLSLIVVTAIVGACGGPPGTSPAASYCDGITSEIGGCDPARPSFSGTTCEAVGAEFGSELDRRLVGIYQGPESKDASKAVRASAATALLASLANIRVRRAGIVKACTAPAFLAAAEARFSPELRAHAGELLADGPAVPYDTWRASLLGLLTILDREEDAPTP